MKIVVFALTIILFSGCYKHEDIIDNSLQVGNILCSDGSIINPALFNSSSKKAVGVVFWCNDGRDASIKDIGYAVALEDLEADFLVNGNEDISKVSENENLLDGATNTSAIISFAKEEEVTCPAIKKTVEYIPNGVSGWFLPSAGQGKLLFYNIEKIYNSFKIVNGKEFKGWYWTSTEDGNGDKSPEIYGLVISIEEGRITNANKMNKNLIRPIIAIR